MDTGGERMLMWECNYVCGTLELVSDVFMWHFNTEYTETHWNGSTWRRLSFTHLQFCLSVVQGAVANGRAKFETQKISPEKPLRFFSSRSKPSTPLLPVKAPKVTKKLRGETPPILQQSLQTLHPSPSGQGTKGNKKVTRRSPSYSSAVAPNPQPLSFQSRHYR
jgi:hypothetical protein